MIIDIVFGILMVLAIFSGLRKGLIVGIFSFLAYIIGMAAALKLSASVAQRLAAHTETANKWLPLISFLLVFIAVVVIVHLVARIIQKAVEMVMLGWLNRIGGAFLYMLMYSMIFSILLFYASKMYVISAETIKESQVYPYIAPFGPRVIEQLGVISPWFKNMFAGLGDFLGKAGR
jgi:membrane protein required for colicin V production